MQKRKFDELISHFNRKVSNMSIDQKYKMELLGMISAIGFAHEKELGTNLAEVGTDCISRQAAIDALRAMQTYKLFAGDDMLLIDQAGAQTELMMLPPAQPVIVPCDYAKACNEVSMNRIASAVVYMEILEDFKKVRICSRGHVGEYAARQQFGKPEQFRHDQQAGGD